MLLSIVYVLLGFLLLTYGADRFVSGAIATARNAGISQLLIGLTIVGFATSAPEILVSATAAWGDNPGVGVGNAIGSNIANVGLVLGVTALVRPLHVHSNIIRKEFVLMFLALGLALYAVFDLELTVPDGLLLLGGLVALMSVMVILGKRQLLPDQLTDELAATAAEEMAAGPALAWLVFGLALLLGGSRLLVSGAVAIASAFGVSDLVIGLTIVAIGTSLPELAASVASAMKGAPEIALGNVVGSNIFNALGVLAMPALICPSTFGPELLRRDVLVMFGLSTALVVMAVSRHGHGEVNRFEGGLLVAAFFSYQYMLFADGG